MGQYNNHNQIPVAYPPPPSTAATAAYVVPPPFGYPTKDAPQNQVPIETTTRGDGFWKGCCAALCCCCALDACF